MRIVLLLILLVGAGLFSVKASKHELQPEAQPAVVKAIVPNVYPPSAIIARAEGSVIIEVKIDSAGKVASAHAVEGNALLRRVAENTAERWEFEPATNGAQQRAVRLTFIYHLASIVNKEEVIFSPPYQVEITYQPPFMVETINY
jgi:TonB family protein